MEYEKEQQEQQAEKKRDTQAESQADNIVKRRRKRASKDRRINMKKNPKIMAIVVVLVIIFLCVGIVLIKKYTPSKKIMKLTEYYQVAEDEVMVVLQDTISEAKGLYIDGVIYVDYETTISEFNKRFYWDANENILSYTTPTEIIRTEVGSDEYYVNKSKSNVSYAIVKTKGEKVYIALDYIKMYSNLEYEFYESPNRVVVNCKWGESFSYREVKKTTKLRYEPNIKSDILADVTVGERLGCLTADEEAVNGFQKVITKDGVVGFVKEKYLGEEYQEQLTNDYEELVYSHISKDYTVNLAWHQVTTAAANDNLLNVLDGTKGVTCVSPTWFEVASKEGAISSLASERYVERAHNAGIEVWALCSDFNKDVSMYELLSNTSRRDKLSNELIANAIKYNLDGINIDFERITKDSAPHYIQFLREFSVKCRNNGIVLSVDSYVPSDYTAYYDREEQGEIVDYVVVMAYDEHHGASEESGSVSSIGFVQDAVKNILDMVPPERVIIALPFYTRVWKEVKEDGKIKVSASAYGMGQAENILTQNGIKPKWDDVTGQYYGEYEAGDALYRVWLEEEKSFELKLKTVMEGKVAGIAAWKLGLEKEGIWNVIMKYVN